VHLKSLTLKGFKSFAKPTTFAFEPGVTCVVGPNGSGKSNVVDALAWVMGEQGAKTLRGGSMEDVIFAGTTTTAPLGRAEVILTIDNADGALPIDYSEVTISRTLFRNGGSEYAINKEPCRLLDVQELLSDSGLGREMHVIVGQGQLDRVLHASPDDRRRFIEEAAGILKHRRRKEKTQRKLESMQANLTRLNDLAGEIRRQLTPLGRQAEVAKQATGIQAIVRDAKARVLADDVDALDQALEGFHLSGRERATERTALGDQATAERRRIAALEETLQDAALDHARSTDFALRQALERLRGLHQVASERAARAEDSATEMMSSTVKDEDIRAQEAQVAAATEAVALHEAVVGQISAALATEKASLAALDAAIAQSVGATRGWDGELRNREAQVELYTSRHHGLEGDLARQTHAVENATERVLQAQQLLHEAQNSTDSSPDSVAQAYEAVLGEAEEALVLAEESVGHTRSELHREEKEHEALAAKVSALDLALRSERDDSDLVGAPGVTGRVSDALEVSPGFETAIARALGSLTDAFLVSSRSAALDLVSARGAGDLGRVELVIAEGERALQPEIPGVIPASDVARGPAGVLALLAHTYVANDVAAIAGAWGGKNRLPAGVTVVTKAGDVFGEHVVSTGSGQGSSRLELGAEREAAYSALSGLSTTLERTRFVHEEATAARAIALEQVIVARTQLRQADTQRAEFGERVSRNRASLDAAQAEVARLGEGHRLAEAALEHAGVARNDAIAAHTQFAATVRPAVDDHARSAVAESVDRRVSEEVDARITLEALRQAVRSAVQGRESLVTRRSEDDAARVRENAKHQERLARAARATQVLSVLPRVVELAQSSVEASAATLIAAEAARHSSQSELGTLRTSEAALRERLAAITERVQSLEMHIYERKLQRTTLLERVAEELGLDEHTLLGDYGPQVLIPSDDEGDAIPFNREEQEARLRTAQRTLDQLGRVNPLALEEFHALEERHRFLTEQLADLTKTRKDLEIIMGDIDATMHTIFAEAFADTQRAFDDVFPTLFPGGVGSLSLTTPDDLLTTGIEVSVRPAGKKIERLSLLSGGERSLAAVALLIAIFKARPSPFYILDEVEASLDDANLGRLLGAIEALREDSQLIIITHQKRTMEIADALYGVSMRKDGVSAVVGQRVKDPEASAA